ncbi:MAG: hypothetical protein CUN56_05790 [Phototrophicales bacterium]|nr:MAG: hypothetical protein CUN56_05790 [Phototrophicales bacterium]
MKLEHRAMLQQALDAAKLGDREHAIDMIKEVLAEDEENAHAWLLLARITDNLDEKRIALANVLQIDPVNVKAKELLEKLEQQVAERDAEPEIIPGVSRRMAYIIGGVVVAFIFVVVFVLIIINNNQENRQRQRAAAATNAFLAPTRTYEAFQIAAANATATEIAINPPTTTPIPTSSLPTLPPTPTETPAPSPTPTLVPLPGDLQGVLIGRIGRENYNMDIQIYTYPFNFAPEPIARLEGRTPQLFPDYTRLLFTEEGSGRVDRVVITDMEGVEQPSILDQAQQFGGFEDFYSPDLSADGTKLVVIGDIFGQSNNAVFLIDLNGSSPDAVIRLTNDDAFYADPAISPDGTKIVAVRDDVNSDNPGPDLILIDVASRTFSSLTTNRNALEESSPAWSADGQLIFFTGFDPNAPQTDPTRDANGDGLDDTTGEFIPPIEPGRDIFMIGILTPDNYVARVQDPADDFNPVISPDGNYMAFISNRGGNVYNIYIMHLVTNELYQLTNGTENSYVNDWR